MAILPEFLLQILAGTVDVDEPRALDLQRQRRGLQVAVFSVEMIAGGGVADERAIHRCWSGENFAGRKICPVTRGDEPAGLHPIEATGEIPSHFFSRFSPYPCGS